MNPSGTVSCSSEERGEHTSWVCDSVWDNPTHQAVSAMSVGLENARQFPRGVDWDWTATAVNNPLLLSHNHQNHRYHNHHQEQSDSEEQKPQITAVAPPMGSFRQYNMGLGFASHPHHHHHHHHQNALGLLNSSGIRNFGNAHDGIPSSPSFHPGLLYTEMPGFGGVGGYDSRSQLLGMMSMQEQHHHKEGAIFHDIVKREGVCAEDFQARIGLNLGHRTYFSAEDTAVSRLYKRPRAIPPASQVPRCQAEGCKADLSNAKHYHRRHKVCEFHSKATSVVTAGVQQRFCQQCSRFHVLSEFDEVKRSCRKRLADHNRRRRKPQPNAVVSAVSSNGETSTTAAKAEGDSNDKNGPGSNETRGLQVAPAMRTESQALLNAMSLPLMLQNGKGQMTSNPNANSNSNPSTNPPVLQPNSHKVSPVPCQQQQYTQGPSLSMGLCNQKQAAAAAAAAAQDYSGLELALPWLRPSSEYSGSHHRPSPAMDILQPLMSEKADVEGFSSSIQNFLPLSASNSREMGTASHWMVGNGGNTGGLETGQQQMFSLLENPAAVRAEDSTAQQPPVEYLSHRRHQGGLNSKDTVEGHSDAAKFSEMQSLRPFGQSIYGGGL